MTLERRGATVLVEPYAANIVRVSLSLRREDAMAAPGFGISASPSAAGWTRDDTKAGADRLRSPELEVTVLPEGPPSHPTGTQADIARFFNGSAPWIGLSVHTADGKRLLDLQGWQMAVPNYKDGTADLRYDRRPSDPPFYTVGASFQAAPDEHDYGMGQNQEGYLDHRGRVLHCAHDYNAPSGQSVCVPFLITNQGYGLVWDNPSKTTASFGFNEQNTFTSEVGQRVSFFVIAGDYDAIYRG